MTYRVTTWILETLGILEYLRTYATSQIDTRLPETLQEVIDSSDLSRRLYSFQMQLEGEMKATDALATSTTTSFRKLLARLSNIDELLAKHREEIEALKIERAALSAERDTRI